MRIVSHQTSLTKITDYGENRPCSWQRQRSVLKRGACSSYTQPYAYPYSPKCPLRCSLARAIFKVFSVSVIDLWQRISRQLRFQAVLTALLQCASWVVLESSEDRKCALWSRWCNRYCQIHPCFSAQNVGGSALPNFLFEGATDPPAPLLLRLCLSQNEVKYMNPFPEIKSLKYDFYTLF